MKLQVTSAAVATLFAFAPVAAFSASLDAQEIMSGSVAIVLDDYVVTGPSHLEGPGYVGGNFTSSTGPYYANSDSMPELNLDGVEGGFIVGGDMSIDVQKTGANPGSIEVGGTYSGTNFNGTYEVNDGLGSAIPVAEMTTLFENLALNLSTLEETTGAEITGYTSAGDTNNPVINSGAGVNGIAVLNMTSAEATSLFGNQNASLNNINIDTGVTMIINVAGNIGELRNQLNPDNPYLLFNFYESVDVLNMTAGTFNASILAPFAHVYSSSGGINGTIVAEYLTQQGEIRPYDNVTGFAGTLPATNKIPLPAGAWLIIGGLGALAGARRLRAEAA